MRKEIVGILFPVAFLTSCVPQENSNITITTQPPGAKVYIDGKFIGTTPIEKEITFTSKPIHTLIFVKNGYEKKVLKLSASDIENKKTIFVKLKKLGYKFFPKFSIKYSPEDRTIAYTIEIEKAYEETIENSPNVSRVERVLAEPLPILIGKIDVYSNKLLYTRIYPIQTSGKEKEKLETTVIEIKELQDAIRYLRNMLLHPEDFDYYKGLLDSLVYIKKTSFGEELQITLLLNKINSPEDVKKNKDVIENLIQLAEERLNKLRTVTVKEFSSEIWMTNTNAPSKTRVTYTGRKWIDFSPAIYKDYVYFTSNRGNLKDFDIWRVNISKASGLTKIVNFPYSQEFYLSVDKKTGSMLVFESLPLDALRKQIWTVKVEGTLPSQLKVGEDPDIWGNKIVFVKESANGKKQIWIMNIDGSEETVLTDDTYNSFHPRFSPDGKWIVYVSDAAGNKDIWIMRTDGSHKTQLTTNPSTDTYPVWNTDGYIYFVSNRGLTWGIWRLKPNIKE
jgi:hypothetical protein